MIRDLRGLQFLTSFYLYLTLAKLSPGTIVYPRKNPLMNSLQSLLYRLGFVLVISGICAGCANQAQQSFERPPAPVVVSTAVSQDVSNYMDALGKIVAREVVAIQPQVSGRITKIHFTDGANVRKGQLLFTIDPRPFEANLKQAQANLARDAAAKKQAEANLAREIAREEVVKAFRPKSAIRPPRS